MSELRARAQFSGNPDAAARYILDHPKLAAQDYSSVFIDRDGGVHVIRPHTHETVAASILAKLGKIDLPPELIYSTQQLTRIGGVMHAYFSGEGAGANIDLDFPPSTEQIKALDALNRGTRGTDFRADLYRDGVPVGPHQTTITALVKAINEDKLDAGLGTLY